MSKYHYTQGWLQGSREHPVNTAWPSSGQAPGPRHASELESTVPYWQKDSLHAHSVRSVRAGIDTVVVVVVVVGSGGTRRKERVRRNVVIMLSKKAVIGTQIRCICCYAINKAFPFLATTCDAVIPGRASKRKSDQMHTYLPNQYRQALHISCNQKKPSTCKKSNKSHI
jgi:hypothetical protein